MAHSLDPFLDRVVDLIAERVVSRLQRSGLVIAAQPPPRAAPVVSDPEYLTTRQAAGMLGLTKRQLDQLRAQGGGPKWVMIDSRIRYLRSALLDHGPSFRRAGSRR